MFTLEGGAISWQSAKHSYIADSTMEAEYVATSEAAKEAIWLRNFLLDVKVVPSLQSAIVIYCDNSEAVANAKEPKHIPRVNILSVGIT